MSEMIQRKRWHRRLLIAVGIIAAGLRLIYFHQIEDGPVVQQYRWNETDMNFFHQWALSISRGDWLTDRSLHPFHAPHRLVAAAEHQLVNSPEPLTAEYGRRLWERWYGGKQFHQEPLYPYLIGLTYVITGPDPTYIVVLQMLLGIFATVLTVHLAWRWFSPAHAGLTAVASLLYGPFLFYESLLLRSTLIRVTIVIAVWVTLIALDRGTWRWFAASGVTIGLAYLTKSNVVLYLLGLLVILPFRLRRNRRRVLIAVGAVILGFLLTLTPLIARNVAVGAPPFSISSVGAITFITANAADIPQGQGGYISAYSAEIMSETKGAFLPTVWRTLRTHDGLIDIARMVVRKLLVFVRWTEIPSNSCYAYYRVFSDLTWRWQIGFSGLGILALIGLIIHIESIRRLWPFNLMIGAQLASALIFFNLSRYRVPVVSLLLPFAAGAIIEFIRLCRQRRGALAGLLVTAAVVIGLVLHWTQPISGVAIRPVDFQIGNRLTIAAASQWAQIGDIYTAKDLIDRALSTEPEWLDRLDAQGEDTSLGDDARTIIESFAELHAIAASIERSIGNEAEMLRHDEIFRRYQQHLKRKKPMAERSPPRRQ